MDTRADEFEKLSSEDSNFGTQDRFMARVISRVNKRSATGIKRHDHDLDDHGTISDDRQPWTIGPPEPRLHQW